MKESRWSRARGRPLRVVQVSCYVDPLRREPEQLLSAWPTLANVATAVRRTGVQLSVVQAASTHGTLERDGVSYHFVRERPASKPRRRAGLWASPLTRNVVRQVEQLRPDLVHFHSLSFPLHVHLLRRGLPGVPLLAQDHADGAPPSWRRALARFGFAGLSGVAFTERSLANPFIEAKVLEPSIPIFEVLESSSDFTPGDQAAARAATGLTGDPCLLWLGHLDDNKDPLTVLAALSQISAQLKDPQLWLCYRAAPLLNRVRTRIDGDPILRGRVHMVGSRSHAQVEMYLRAADFLVQGSHREGSGFAVIEALACGTTPLVTDIPSFRRITGNGSVGGLCAPGDMDAMARALLDWPARDRSGLRLSARAHFERALSFDALGQELSAAYYELLEAV